MSATSPYKEGKIITTLLIFSLFLGLIIWLVVWLLSSKKDNFTYDPTISHSLHPLLTQASLANNTFEKKGKMVNPEFPSLHECEVQHNTSVNHDVSGRNNQHCFLRNGKPGFFMAPNLCCPNNSSFGMNPQIVSQAEVAGKGRCCGGCSNCDRSDGYHEKRRFHGLSEFCSRYASTDTGAYQVCINNVL